MRAEPASGSATNFTNFGFVPFVAAFLRSTFNVICSTRNAPTFQPVQEFTFARQTPPPNPVSHVRLFGPPVPVTLKLASTISSGRDLAKTMSSGFRHERFGENAGNSPPGHKPIRGRRLVFPGDLLRN